MRYVVQVVRGHREKGWRRGRRRVAALIGALALMLSLAAVARAAFPQDAPNDPSYAPAEGTPDKCFQNSVNDEEHHHYSFMPQCAPGATDPENASGMSTDKAWKDYTAGNDQTLIAYVEGGINWRNGDAEELANRVFINRAELPVPNHARAAPVPVANTTPTCASYVNAYDANGDGSFNVVDYACDGRVGPQPADTGDSNGNGVLDPEDLIVKFSDGHDGYGAENDANGYVDDISGWDFYNDQNDPATLDSAYGHANGQQKQAAAEVNNGHQGVGVCPRCRLLPVKAGAEALDASYQLAEAWLYAADMKTDVIVSVTADLGYSTFMAQAVQYCWDHDIVMVEASNDFNSIDHQGGMFHEHVLPGNGVVTNSQNIPGPEANAITTTYRARSGLTSWGTHNMFSVATQGGSTSESTPTVGGALALVIAEGKEASAQHLINTPLSNSEAIQIVRDTASPITGNPNPPLGWEGNANSNWNMQYGYGRPNLWKALKKVHDNQIPPEAWIDSPEWYRVFDPSKPAQQSVAVTGHVEAPRSSVQGWKLEFAPGAEPADAAFHTAATGTTAKDGTLGNIDLSQVPASFWDQAQNPFHLSSTKTLETNDQYTVTIRVRVTDANGRLAEERRAIAVTHDPSIREGFPKLLGDHDGIAQPQLVDLQGTGRLDIVFGDSDGVIHAIDPVTGNELPGWPAHTTAVQVTKAHPGLSPGYESVLFSVAVGDVNHDGTLEVAVASVGGHEYLFDSHGALLPGWPRALDAGVSKPAIPRPDLPFTRVPIQAAISPPVMADLDGDGHLEVVQTAGDGRIHVFRTDGSDFPGWPVEVKLPDGYQPGNGNSIVIQDHKLDTPPTIADLDGDRHPEIVVRSQYGDAQGGDIQPGGVSHLHAFHADGSPVNGFPNNVQGIIIYYGSAQEAITEGTNSPISADVNGDGSDELETSPVIFSPSYQIKGDGSVGTVYGPEPDPVVVDALQRQASPDQLTGFLNGNLPTDVPVNFTTSGAFGHFGPGDNLTMAEPGSGGASVAGSLVTAGSGVAISNYMRAFDAQSGAVMPGFPAKQQGLNFLGSPTIADVTGDGSAEILAGGDSSALHGFAFGGGQAAGFPKFQSGWLLGSPTVGDLDGDGKVELVATTREGYLYAWNTDGTTAGNDEWWSVRHDERNSGHYGSDTRPPGALRDAQLSGDHNTISWKAPGDDWYAGKADHYEIVQSDSRITPPSYDQAESVSGPPAPADPGAAQTFQVPSGAKRYIAVRAVDNAGNLGPPAIFQLRPEPPPPVMKLTVSPREARTGKTYNFRLSVSSASTSCRSGATVRLGGESATTGSTGVAHISHRFSSPGKKVAKAAKSGCAPDEATVTVVRRR
ncbi:MAG: hypothetical protein QOJ38_676 [Solirubrobacterales bacterium]|nr:hypothetical protein [Solirubrobacterales bacterium]